MNSNLNLNILPDRNAYTNPSSISNSGASYFTNPRSKIYKLNLNLVSNGNLLNEFLITQYEELKSNQTQLEINQIPSNDFLTILENQKKKSKLNKLFLN